MAQTGYPSKYPLTKCIEPSPIIPTYSLRRHLPDKMQKWGYADGPSLHDPSQEWETKNVDLRVGYNGLRLQCYMHTNNNKLARFSRLIYDRTKYSLLAKQLG